MPHCRGFFQAANFLSYFARFLRTADQEDRLACCSVICRVLFSCVLYLLLQCTLLDSVFLFFIFFIFFKCKHTTVQGYLDKKQ